MPWFKVDDGLHSHPKWLAASLAARGLWVTAGSWCSDHTTDGVVPRHVLVSLGATRRHAAELVTAGLWEDHPDGWMFHDWLDRNPSAEQVEAERAATRERQRRAREKAASRRDGTVSDAQLTPRVTVPPTRPDPIDEVCTRGSPPLTPADPNEEAVAAVDFDHHPPPRHDPDTSDELVANIRTLRRTTFTPPEDAA